MFPTLAAGSARILYGIRRKPDPLSPQGRDRTRRAPEEFVPPGIRPRDAAPAGVPFLHACENSRNRPAAARACSSILVFQRSAFEPDRPAPRRHLRSPDLGILHPYSLRSARPAI